MKRERIFLLCVVLAFATFSLSSAADDQQMVSKQMTVTKDSVFTVDLPCAAGRGFSWQLADSSLLGKVRLVRQTFENGPSDKDGADGTQHFEFQAIAPGSVDLKFLYVQPFKKPFPADSREAHVSVKITENI